LRAFAICLLGLALACCPESEAAAKKHKSSCQKLRTRHKDIAASRKLVVVERGGDNAGRIRACVLPRGRVRTLAEWDDYSGVSSVMDTAGTYVLLSANATDPDSGAYGRSLTRIEVRRNKTLELAGRGCPPGAFDCDEYGTGAEFGKAAVARSGAGAFERNEVTTKVVGTLVLHPRITTLQGFDAAGALTTLADGAVDDLRVTSTQVSWTQAGVAHTAPLPGAATP
jgi:hypothetical protein